MAVIAVCIFTFVGCSSSGVNEEDLSYADAPENYAAVDDEDPIDTSEPEDAFVDDRPPDRPPLSAGPPSRRLPALRDYFTDREQDFIDTLHAVGLVDWEFTVDQRMLVPPNAWDYHVFNITTPQDLAHGFIIVRIGEGWVYGDKHISMLFIPRGQLSVERFNLFLEQEYVITHDDLFMFWEFAGRIIDEVDDVLSIANRMMDYVEAFQFDYLGDDVDDPFSWGITLMEGRYGNVDYRFGLGWRDIYARYFAYEIELTAGLEEEWRQHRIDSDFWN